MVPNMVSEETVDRHLLVNPKDRRVVVVESVLCPSSSRELLADILFNHFEVYEGYTLLNAWQSAQLGAKRIHEDIKCYLSEKAKLVDVINGESHFSPCPDSFVPQSRAMQWKAWRDAVEPSVKKPSSHQETFLFPLDRLGDERPIQVPSEVRELAVECLFSGDNDQITVTTLILRSILLAPIDIRRNLAENIILIGGTVMIPGFLPRLQEELNSHLDLPEFSTLQALKGSFKFHTPPGEANYIGWLGGAIFGALECLPGRSLSRISYLENGIVPDWCTQIDQTHKDLERQDTTRQ
ncbi:unnamed protein product [Trichobilharzia regenti]|nr:unnamed protein product [Trichobilharzia regenti]